MRAIAVEAFGATPHLVEVPKPTPGPGELLVRVSYSGVNPMDWKNAAAPFRDVPADFPLILGTDGAGVVDEVGPGVTRFAAGDRVFGQFRHAPAGHGTEAEYTVVDESTDIAKIPEGLDDIDAAALPTAGLTALRILEALDLTPGSTMLIVGATGGVGMFLTQLATQRGFSVIATARPEMVERMQELGAWDTVDHTSITPLAEQVRMIVPAGVDAYVDLVNDSDTVAEIGGAVRPAGRVVSSIGQASPESLAPKGLTAVRLGASTDAPGRLDQLARLVVRGLLEAPAEVEPLAKAPEVLDRSRTGHVHGKTVLRVAE